MRTGRVRTIAAAVIVTSILGAAPVSYGQAYIKTELSKKTKKIKRGMSREQVIEILGPATWAILPSDGGLFAITNYNRIRLDLRWDNGPECLPVSVQLDRDHRVLAVGKGRTCRRGGIDPATIPTAEYSCEREDRRELCR